MKRKGATTREIFYNNNPFKEKITNPVDMPDNRIQESQLMSMEKDSSYSRGGIMD